MIQFYHFSRCSKSRQALAILEEKNIDFSIRYYLDEPLSKEEILSLQQKTGLPLIEIVRSSESIYKELFGKDIPKDTQLIEAIVRNPILLQRPIVETEKCAVIARPPEKLLEII